MNYKLAIEKNDINPLINTTPTKTSIVSQTKVKEPNVITKDYINETFIDMNLDLFLNIHDYLKYEFESIGFMNTSLSNEFINMLMKSITINGSLCHGYQSSDEDS